MRLVLALALALALPTAIAAPSILAPIWKAAQTKPEGCTKDGRNCFSLTYVPPATLAQRLKVQWSRREDGSYIALVGAVQVTLVEDSGSGGWSIYTLTR